MTNPTDVNPHEMIRQIAQEHGLIAVVWSPEDVQSYDETKTLDECADALASIGDDLVNRCIETGWDVMSVLLQMDGFFDNEQEA